MPHDVRYRLFIAGVILQFSFTVLFGAQEDYSSWPNAQKVVLNTSNTGANVTGNLYGFPVLVRLIPSNFSGFSSTLAQGADVRFAKANGTALPYEIERWIDGSNNNDTAEIWVRVDTVFGSNSSQYIMMYWGKSGVSTRSNGAAVFDTGNGFVAVYHLKEDLDNAADATSNGNTAARIGMPVRATGIIGYSQIFSGSSVYYKTNSFDKANFGSVFSISAWVYLPGGIASPGALWSKGNDNTNWDLQETQFYLGDNTHNQNQQGRYPELVGCSRNWINANSALGTDTWQYITFIFNSSNSTRQIYINGQSVSLSDNSYSGGIDNAGDIFFIGRDISGEAANDFHGAMDEVVVSKVVRPANWVKLSFENQKANQSLVSFTVIDNENYADWPYSQKIFLNTSASGANVTGNVANFPIVILLNPSTFKSFSQTMAGGTDIRFAKSNGTHLPYEIERWADGSNNSDTAEVWVKIDTVFGNNSLQYITMYWGRSGVASKSNSAAVFETVNDFQGVWHLNESPGGGANAIRDRTINASHGTPQNGLGADDQVNGIIGKSLNFDGPYASGGDWLQLPNSTALDNTGNMTISCWFRMTNGSNNNFYGIAGKYSESGSSWRGYGLCRADNQYVRFIAGNGASAIYVASNSAVNDNIWHHLAGVVYSNTLYLYVDGTLQGASTAGAPVASGGYGTVGRQAGNIDYRYLSGDIDEVQISKTARPPNWVKLSYENQKSGQTLVSMTPVNMENYATWPYSQRLYFNTGSGGAKVSGTVTDFPVLVRLNPAVFTHFSETQPGGVDIRFAKADDTPLPYEIERWKDGSNNTDTAEIWVLMDTVIGNSTAQYITMYWGRTGVGSMANPGAVFDTSHGFGGVWHFTGNSFSDATVNGNTGFNSGTDDTAGIIGTGRKFADPDYIEVAGLMGTPAAVTLSCWAKVDAQDALGADLISIGDYVVLRNYSPHAQNVYHYASGWRTDDATELLGAGWKYVTFVCNPSGSLQQIYIDGIADTSPGTYRDAIDYTGVGTNTQFGRHGNLSADYNFGGVLDEVRIDKTVRSADWIKLCFENQKKTQSLVSFAVADNENYATWPYFQKIYLNTSQTGANCTETVTQFPVLVRLNPSIFKNFSQTLAGGADIRFAKSSGTHLPYEIERWVDGTNNNDTAEIWVKVDTVFGNNNQQFILMYWGRSGVSGRSNANAVFDVNNSFQGVWHLNESPVGANAVKDRTMNANHGTPQNNLTSDDLVNGVIGRSLNFDGPASAGGDYVRIQNSPSMDNTGNMTVSCWFRLTNSGSTDYYGIAGMYKDSASTYSGYGIGRATSQRVRFVVGNGSSGAGMFVESNSTVIDNSWHHAAGVVNGGTLGLFLDGARQSATASGTPVATGGYAVIGRRSGNLDNGYFMGDLDEVRFNKTARSAGWIKLCFENQKPAQTLVSFIAVDNENYSTWASSQKMYINTTATGANIQGTVTGFPLLVRLDPSTFPGFAATLPGGADVRFASSEGTHLAYEIERWIDGGNNNDTAEIWVRADTVRGNNALQYIRMHWGKSGVTSASNGREVFDIRNGFVAAYHLNEAAGNATDATANTLNAVPKGALPDRRSGSVGYGAYFNGGSTYYNAGNDVRFGATDGNALTLSAWVNRSGSNACRTQWEGIAGKYKWANASGREYALGCDTTPDKGFYFVTSTDGTSATEQNVVSKVYPVIGAWNQVVGIFDGSNVLIYVDGALKSSATRNVLFNSLNADFKIGCIDSSRSNFYQTFNGKIDEITVSKVARSADWIKLSYETQKPSDSCCIIPEFLASPVIDGNTPADQAARQGSVVGMTVRASGCGPFSYRWYKNSLSVADTIPGQRDSVLRFSSVHPSDGGSYICVVANVYGSDTSRAAVLTVEPDQQIVNPIILRGTFVDSTHVTLSISRYSNLPVAPTATFPWYADSVWVWYRANDFPAGPLPGVSDLFLFPLSVLRKNATDQFDTVLTVPRYPSTSCYHYFFSPSVYWKNVDGVTDSIAPFADQLTSGAAVLMCDTSALLNPLRFSFDYSEQTDSIVVSLSPMTQLEWDLISAIEVRYSVGSATAVVDRMPISGFERSVDIFMKTYKDLRFIGEEKWVYWEVLPIGKYGNLSVPVRDSCRVGVPRPSNTLSLSVGSVTSSRVNLFWQRPVVSVDSIRLWYGLQEVPLGVDISPAVYGSLVIPGTDTAVVVSGLSASTTYYFGLQIQKAGMWSVVTTASRALATTGEIEDTVSMPNKLRLLSLAFDQATNSVVLEWAVDTSGLSLEAGIVWSKDSIGYPEPKPPVVGRVVAITDGAASMRYSVTVSVTDLLFNNTYFFAVWLRKINGKWMQPTAASTGKVFIPPATWESVVIFRTTDTVRALGGQVVLRKIEEMTVEGKLRIVTLPVATSGCIPMSIGVDFDLPGAPPIPLDFGLKYGALPQGYRTSDLRMYHYIDTQGIWIIDTLSSTVDSVEQILFVKIRASECSRYPFIVMIDTVRPVISLINDSEDAVPANVPLSLMIRSRDNIANTRIELLGGRGGDRLSLSQTVYGSRPVDTTVWIVPGSVMSEESGARLLLSVSDGRFDSTINVSRDVVRVISDSAQTGWLQWQPLGPAAILDDNSIGTVLHDYAASDNALRYDKTLLRIYKWSTDRWEEYSDGRRELFNLEPTRVIWVKRRLIKPIYYGKGRTASLRNPYRISVPAGGWVDFCLPYRFNVRVGDILSASGIGEGQSSFLFYEWRRGGNDSLKRYYADPVYLPLTEGKNDPAYELTSRNSTVYTVYNGAAAAKEVVIPGIPVVLSNVTGKKASVGEWSVAVRATSSEGTVNPLYCGFREGIKKRIFYPHAPSWNGVRIGVYDEITRSYGGAILVGELSGGGQCFEVVFENDTRKKEKISYRIEQRLEPGGELTVAIIDPETGSLTAVHDSMTVEVGPNDRVYRWLAVGSADYFSSLVRLPFRGEFRIERALPNPFRQSLRIRYNIPYGGIESIQCEIFDPRGRLLWKLQAGPRLHPGPQELVWTPRKEKALAAGTYIIQLSGFDGRNRKTGNRITRVTYLP